MLVVELIYDKDCPNVENARAQLSKAFEWAAIMPQWKEWDCSDPKSPSHIRLCGSPTILINGYDVSGEESSSRGQSCRLYKNEVGQWQRTPSAEMIVSALRRR